MSLPDLNRWGVLIRTLSRLGWRNLVRAGMYRLLLKTHAHPACRLKGPQVEPPFFAKPTQLRNLPASKYWEDSARYFDNIEVPIANGKPNWFYKLASGKPISPSMLPWWKTGESDANLGDIKDIWDISRFNWVLALSQRAAQGDEKSLVTLNEWLTDWTASNPPYLGYNWKCGQEAAIRVMHLAMGALILRQTEAPLPGLCALVRTHLIRIRPTMSYAVAQDNNHGVCEAAGLFIGGAWLYTIERSTQARGWMEKGQRQLEERAARLIADDGGFSMYSVTYHREFLDAMSMAEVWRRTLNLPEFSEEYRIRAAATTQWLAECVHPDSGDAPNIGPNDGTRLLPLTDSGYRDFRPSVQLAAVLFCGARAYANLGHWDVPLQWLDILAPDTVLSHAKSRLSHDTGFAFLRSPAEDAQVIVRFPHYRFRPGHADPLHLDFWLHGRNILCGPGSYCYNADSESQAYFPSVIAHNTVQFDDTEAMPRLGRFLFGDWLKTKELEPLQNDARSTHFGVGYAIRQKTGHHRQITLTDQTLNVTDVVSGFKEKAVLRWRLTSGHWNLSIEDSRVQVSSAEHPGVVLTVCTQGKWHRCELVEGWESRHYLEKTPIPVLEFEVTKACTITTEVSWVS